MSRWLVLGCAGFIGSHLAEGLLERGPVFEGVFHSVFLADMCRIQPEAGWSSETPLETGLLLQLEEARVLV